MHLANQYLLSFLLCLLSTVATANDSILWQDTPKLGARSSNTDTKTDTEIRNARSLNLNVEAMRSLLVPSSDKPNTQARKSGLLSIEIPLPDGSNVRLELEQTNILPSTLAKQYTQIRTYKVAQPNGDIISGRVDFTEHGFHAMLQTFDGQTIFVDPANKQTTDRYLSYRKAEQAKHSFQCNSPGHNHHKLSFSPIQHRVAARTRSNEGIVEYRIAIAATAEYTQLQGGTVSTALSAMATTLNRVNHIYEQSLGVRLSLVEQNDQLIYTDSNSDPYSNYNIENMLAENQRNLDLVIGSANYDIGHVFGTSGGGLAYIGSVCNSSNKARGASGIRNPNNDSFDIDYVAHEIGHQFGATHTFNSNQGICTSGARTARTAFEPGSGSSIMSYVGGCGSDDLQQFADAMFHSGNIEQINKNIVSGAASSCGIIHTTNNTAPVAMAGNSFTIPANTPFELTAEALDADGDELRYSWEQIDTGTASALRLDTGDNPLFRILPPTKEATRSFPALSTILGHGLVKGETLPSTTRSMNFQLAVYDGHHVPSLDQVRINSINTGSSFRLKAPAAQYQQGNHIAIHWNTANTQAPPISCQTVDLSLSTNGGISFDTVLAKGIQNSGNESVFLPESIQSTDNARFKLSCSNNIFFSISPQPFTISPIPLSLATGPRNSSDANLADSNTLSGGGSMGFLSICIFFILIFVRANNRPNPRPLVI